MFSTCKQPLARLASQDTDSCSQTGGQEPCGAEMWQQDLLPAGCGVDTDSCSQTRTGAMWGRDVATGPPREADCGARLRLGLPFSLCFVAVFFFCFFCFPSPCCLFCQEARQHARTKLKAVTRPGRFYTPPLMFACLTEPRPVSPCHDH